MKITPLPSFANSMTPQAPLPETMRTLKMNTLATPEQIVSPELVIQDTNEAKAVTEDTQPISPQFAELARKRRSLQIKERELTDREKALEARGQDGDAISLARLKSEPLKVLLESGVTYDQLTEAILANQGNSELNALKAEIAALKEGVDKKFTDQQVQTKQQVLAEMKREATELAQSGETYALVREMGHIPDVIRLIDETYEKEGRIMDVTEALEEFEKHLLDKFGPKIAGLEKMRSLYAPQPMLRPQGMRTLTNRDTASVPMSPKQRALAAFHGTLKR